jgi:hypothetical protein
MRRIGGCLALALVVGLLAATCALADDTEVGGSVGAVKPLTNTTISMESETVQAILYSRFAEYRADFHFVNSGPQQEVTLGFPFPLPSGEGDQVPPAAFRAWQDGRALTVSVVKGKDGPTPTNFYAHTVDFPPGKTTVTVDYLAAPTWSVGDVLQSGAVTATPPPAYAGEAAYWHLYDYTLHTGANWAGSIGTAVLRYTLSDDFVGWGVPAAVAMNANSDLQYGEGTDSLATQQRDTLMGQYRQPAPNVYQWDFRGLEPTITADGFSASDIGLTYFAPPNSPMPNSPDRYVGPTTTESSSLKLDGYEYPSEQISDGLPATTWAENAPGSGVGQWVSFAWPQPRRIRELRILPGYAKTPDLFYKYNRPKRLKFSFSDGTEKIVDLANEPSLQRFPVNANAQSVRMTIEDVYRGTTRDETYVSEVEFGSAKAPEFMDSQTLLTQASSPNKGAGNSGEQTRRTSPGYVVSVGPSAGALPKVVVLVGLVALCGMLIALTLVIVVLVVLIARTKGPGAEHEGASAPTEPPPAT